MAVIINSDSLSQDEYKKDLRKHLESLPEFDSVNDFFTGSAGEIILNMIAGVSSFNGTQQVLNIHESTIDFAKLESSVVENAFDRGLLLAPTKAPEIQINMWATMPTTINRGDLIATIDAYEVYSLDSVILNSTPVDVKAVIGNKITKSFVLGTLQNFTSFKIPISDSLVASQLESIMSDTEELKLRADFNETTDYWHDFILRRLRPGEVVLYTGNGSLGWLDKDASTLTYTALTYDLTVNNSLNSSLSFISPAVKSSGFTTLLKAQGLPNKEELRGITRYYPLDGRIVQDRDYESVILKYFGGVVLDVYSYNTDPTQVVHILWDTGYEAGGQLEDIKSRVNSRRGLGIEVVYQVIDKSKGKSIAFTAKVLGSEGLNGTDVEKVNNYITDKTYKFSREETHVSSVDICADLSALIGKSIIPATILETYLDPDDFLSEINLTFEVVSRDNIVGSSEGLTESSSNEIKYVATVAAGEEERIDEISISDGNSSKWFVTLTNIDETKSKYFEISSVYTSGSIKYAIYASVGDAFSDRSYVELSNDDKMELRILNQSAEDFNVTAIRLV